MPEVHTTSRRVAHLAATALAGVVATAALCGSVLVATTSAYAASAVGLGTAESFAVLAGSGITNTGATTITGDVGSFPTLTQTGFGTVTLIGTNHFGDAVTQGAKTDLVTAYNDAAGRTPATSVPVELGGTTLLSGVYTSPTLGLTGTLTLDAQGNPNAEFIFQAGSTLIAESGSRVLLINGADPCRVVWQVGSSATFKTGTGFVGDVLAMTSITAQTSATFQGRLLARNGAVTMDNNTITNASCVTSSVTTTTVADGATTTTSTTSPSTTTSTTTTPVPATTAPATPLGPTATPGAETVAPGSAAAGGPTAAEGRTPPSATAPPTASSGPGPGTPALATTGSPLGGMAATGLGLLTLGALALAGTKRTR